MTRACRGRCSPIWMPGTLVAIGLNSPRTSTGALGLRSYMSMWLGPPASHSRMTDRRGVPFSRAWARRHSRPGSVSPPSARLPTFRKVRRLTPSQVRGPRPMNSSMVVPPYFSLPAPCHGGVRHSLRGDLHIIDDTGRLRHRKAVLAQPLEVNFDGL